MKNSKNHKTREVYATGLKECLNPEKCKCYLCREWREHRCKSGGATMPKEQGELKRWKQIREKLMAFKHGRMSLGTIISFIRGEIKTGEIEPYKIGKTIQKNC